MKDMSHETKDAIKSATAAAEHVKRLLDERLDRYALGADDQSRAYFDVDKERLNASIGIAAIALDQASVELHLMLNATINKEYFTESPYRLDIEKNQLKRYKTTLRELCQEGVVTERRLAVHAHKIHKRSILSNYYDTSDDDSEPEPKRVKTKRDGDIKVKVEIKREG
jgi:hypothetical protein